MSGVHAQINRRIALVLGACGLGFVVLILAIAVFDSPPVAGVALAWTLAGLLVARHVLRCPLCGASVLNAPVGTAAGWITGRNRKCPRCHTNYAEAVAEIRRRKTG